MFVDTTTVGPGAEIGNVFGQATQLLGNEGSSPKIDPLPSLQPKTKPDSKTKRAKNLPETSSSPPKESQRARSPPQETQRARPRACSPKSLKPESAKASESQPIPPPSQECFEVVTRCEELKALVSRDIDFHSRISLGPVLSSFDVLSNVAKEKGVDASQVAACCDALRKLAAAESSQNSIRGLPTRGKRSDGKAFRDCMINCCDTLKILSQQKAATKNLRVDAGPDSSGLAGCTSGIEESHATPADEKTTQLLEYEKALQSCVEMLQQNILRHYSEVQKGVYNSLDGLLKKKKGPRAGSRSPPPASGSSGEVVDPIESTSQILKKQSLLKKLTDPWTTEHSGADLSPRSRKRLEPGSPDRIRRILQMLKTRAEADQKEHEEPWVNPVVMRVEAPSQAIFPPMLSGSKQTGEKCQPERNKAAGEPKSPRRKVATDPERSISVVSKDIDYRGEIESAASRCQELTGLVPQFYPKDYSFNSLELSSSNAPIEFSESSSDSSSDLTSSSSTVSSTCPSAIEQAIQCGDKKTRKRL